MTRCTHTWRRDDGTKVRCSLYTGHHGCHDSGPRRAAEGGYPPNTCRAIYAHGDKDRVCCRVMGHDGAHSPRDRERFPDDYS